MQVSEKDVDATYILIFQPWEQVPLPLAVASDGISMLHSIILDQERTGLWRWGLEIPYSRNEIKTLSKILRGQWSVEAAGDASFLGSFMWLPPLLLIRPTRVGRWMSQRLRALKIPILEEYLSEWLSIRVVKE